MTDVSSVLLIGCGNMGGALLAGWLDSGFKANNITVVDPKIAPEQTVFWQRSGVQIVSAIPRLINQHSVVIAVDPRVSDEVFGQLPGRLSVNSVVISVVAGKKLSGIEKIVPDNPIIRAMPNIAVKAYCGVSALCANVSCNKHHRLLVDVLFASVGEVIWVEDEDQMDGVSAISGSGPAYVFYFAEALTKAAVSLGLSPQDGATLARGTVSGAGAMLHAFDDPAKDMRNSVTSPNGVTEAGLKVLMGGLDELLQKTTAAAARRCRELADESS